jgi:hypothetical protein
MTLTAQLGITKIDSSQNQGGVTANAAFDVLDAALSEFELAMPDANYTLSTSTTPAEEWQYGIINATGTLTASRNIVTRVNKKLYVFKNGTTGGFPITFKTASGTGVAVAAGETAILRCDGTNIVLVSRSGIKRIVSQTFSATPTFDWSDADVIRMTLTGNITSITMTGAVDEQNCVLELTQDATGSRTLASPSSFRFSADIPSITLTTTASKMDRIGFQYNSVASKYDVVAKVQGY